AAVRRVLLEEQVVEDETEVGLAGAVVDELNVGALGQGLGQQGLDELVQVIDLLQLAPAVLVELAGAGEDVQLLEQLEGLLGTDFGVVDGHGAACRMRGSARTVLRRPARTKPAQVDAWDRSGCLPRDDGGNRGYAPADLNQWPCRMPCPACRKGLRGRLAGCIAARRSEERRVGRESSCGGSRHRRSA